MLILLVLTIICWIVIQCYKYYKSYSLDFKEYKNQKVECHTDLQINSNDINNEPIGIADPIEKRYYWTTKDKLPVGFNPDDVQGKRYFRGHLYQGSEQFIG